MTDAPNQTPPGWYPNQQGQTQWWDGNTWGPTAPQQQVQVLMAQQHPQQKSVGAAYCFLIFLGGTGAHRFYMGNVGRGTVMLLLFIVALPLAILPTDISFVGYIALAILWIMQLIDLFSLAGDVRRHNAALYQG